MALNSCCLLKRKRIEEVPDSIIRLRGGPDIITDDVTGAKYRRYRENVVNMIGPFFNSFNTKNGSHPFRNIGSFGANTNGGRVLAILHELAHLVYGKDGPIIPDDDSNQDGGDKSNKNTKTIDDKCGKDIKQFLPDWKNH